MHKLNETRNRRILVIDDNEAIHADFRKILSSGAKNTGVEDSYEALFGEEPEETGNLSFEIETASQGKEGLGKVCKSLEERRPYAIAFVDVRMPPGWDGIETIGHLWKADPNLLVVICTAYNDYNWNEMSGKLGHMDQWLVLRKPFDNVEVRQFAASLSEKWDLARKADLKLSELQTMANATARRLLAFREAVDSGGVVAVTDAKGTILEVNDNFCDVSGYSREELIGQDHRLLKSDHHPKVFFKEMYATLAKGEIWRGEICNRSKDDSLHWVDTTIVPMRDENENTEGYFTLRFEISERKRLMGKLQELAYYDALTGLPNRASIIRSIQNVIDRKDESCFALLFLDFDRFKLINDSLGHDVGDELLKEIAIRLNKTLRATDEILPARLGGDEFVVLLEGLASPADATFVVERLQEAFSESYQLGIHTVYSTASIGVVTSEHRYGSATEMLRDADLAMYKAKAAGKDRFVVFDSTLREKAQARLFIENDLREAISRNELFLVYQPIVSLETGQLEGVETLLRWMHPEQGLISPVNFISVAEETGSILAIGNWVLDNACRQLADWRYRLGADAPSCIHVNVSRKQFVLQDMVTVVEQALAKHAIPPECLHLEVTESMVMDDPEAAAVTLKNLRRMGLKIDMDDFGTGYSSLSCLHEFPIDVLKIDRSFIANIKRRHEFSALLDAMITMAGSLGMQVVAEGIEDAEQLALLQSLGCDFGQGYFFSKPKPPEEVEAFFKSPSKLPMSKSIPIPVDPLLLAT